MMMNMTSMPRMKAPAVSGLNGIVASRFRFPSKSTEGGVVFLFHKFERIIGNVPRVALRVYFRADLVIQLIEVAQGLYRRVQWRVDLESHMKRQDDTLKEMRDDIKQIIRDKVTPG